MPIFTSKLASCARGYEEWISNGITNVASVCFIVVHPALGNPSHVQMIYAHSRCGLRENPWFTSMILPFNFRFSGISLATCHYQRAICSSYGFPSSISIPGPGPGKPTGACRRIGGFRSHGGTPKIIHFARIVYFVNHLCWGSHLWNLHISYTIHIIHYMWLWPRMRDTASWPSTHFLNDDNPHLLNLWEICSLILTYTPIWQGAPRLCGYHPPLKIDLAKWRGGRQFLNVLNSWLFGYYVKFGYRLIPSIGWMEDVHQTPTISYEVGKSVVCCKKLFPWTSPWRQLPAGCPLGRSRELQPKKAQSLLDTYERKCEEFGGLRSQDTRRLQFVCIQFYVYSTCVYIYIHTHTNAL